MGRKAAIVFILVFIGCSLIACSRGPAAQKVNLEGSVKTLTSGGVFVYGKSNLPENTTVNGQLLDLEGKSVYVNEEAKTDKDGSFAIEMKRPELEQEYKLQVVFNPEEQEEEIKESFGDKGQYISEDSKGYVESMNDKDISGIVMYDQVFKIATEGTANQLGQQTSLNSSFEVIDGD